MLFLEHRVIALEGLQGRELAPRSRWQGPTPYPALDHAVPDFLPPPREHEGMDVEGVGDGLDLDPRHMAELHSRQLELGAVAMDLPQAWLAHSTPPSVS